MSASRPTAISPFLVRPKILAGAGLAGYGAKLQAHQPIPLIDSAQAGLNILLSDKAPAPLAKVNGFHAQWSNVRLGLM